MHRTCGELLWSSIHNIDSRDLDQMEDREREKNGEIHVQVAIADVDSRVKKNSGSTSMRPITAPPSTSMSTPSPCCPTRSPASLPAARQGLPRDDRGLLGAYGRHNTVRPVYPVGRGQQGKACLRAGGRLARRDRAHTGECGDGPRPRGPAPLQNEAAVRLRQRRTGQGALDLETIEAQAIYQQGRVKEAVVLEENPARSLIEEFMVAANRTMMAFLSAAGIPAESGSSGPRRTGKASC